MEELDVWRLVRGQYATLYELETTWSLDDIARATAVLNVTEEIERLIIEGNQSS